MNIDDLDRVTPIRNYRKHCINMLFGIRHGHFDVQVGVDQVSLSTQMNLMDLRSLIAEQVLKHIHTLEDQLRSYGFEVEATK